MSADSHTRLLSALELTEAPSLPAQSPPVHSPAATNTSSTIALLVGRILNELETQPQKLTQLNRSRRESVAQHIEMLIGKSISSNPTDDRLKLLLSKAREPECARALRCFYEEVALIQIGMALTLKSWSDRKQRPLKRDDLANLNWTLNTALKSYQSLDRESRQITKQNLYSWYIPSESIQTEIWNALNPIDLSSVSSHFLVELLELCWLSAPQWPEIKSYNDLFFEQIHRWAESLIPQPEVESLIPRIKKGFSLSLRNGKPIFASSIGEWVGFEQNSFQLLMAELMQLWPSPSVSPVWIQGTGFESFAGDQLNFDLDSPIPSSQKRAKEMEDFDFSLLCEEKSLRTMGRSLEGTRLKEVLEAFPQIRKLKSQTTSLGALQACISVSKLRPGGLFVWLREEPLQSTEGTEVLQYLLDRATLEGEWNLSDLKSSMHASRFAHPQFVYLFRREIHHEKRAQHHPIRYRISGNLRSALEIPYAIEDMLMGSRRGNWTIQKEVSISSQHDWMDRWPDAASLEVSARMADLRNKTLPLASVAPVLPVQNLSSYRSSEMHLWVRYENSKLRVYSDPVAKAEFSILVSQSSMRPLLVQYLESPIVQEWLEFSIAQRGGKAVLFETDLKWIPIPKPLAKFLSAENGSLEMAYDLVQHPSWQVFLNSLRHQPEQCANLIPKILESARSPEEREEWSTVIWIEIARQRSEAMENSGRYSTLILSDAQGKDQIQWAGIMGLLPQSELVPVTLHPALEIHGKIPQHSPIVRIERSKGHLTSLILLTENNGMLSLQSQQSAWIELIESQLKGMEHPTWSDLAQFLKLPKKLEKIQMLAQEVFTTYQETLMKQQGLDKLISLCPLI